MPRRATPLIEALKEQVATEERAVVMAAEAFDKHWSRRALCDTWDTAHPLSVAVRQLQAARLRLARASRPRSTP